MPDYQWAVGKGRIVIEDYDRSMALSAEQVEGELKSAITDLFDHAEVFSINDDYKEVYKIKIPREEETQVFFVCLKGTTPGGRSNLQNEQRIQQKAKYLNYANDRKNEGNKVSCIGVYRHNSETVFCAWNINPSTASPETPISKQIKITTIARALTEGFVQQMSGSGEYVCAFKKDFIYFYLVNSHWIHTAPISHLNEHNAEMVEEETSLAGEKTNKNGDNILLYGVPGSGKSHTIKMQYCDNDAYMERAVFHPDYTYSDFVGQILPKVSEDGKVTYEFEPGPFTRILKMANNDPENNYYLVVEEINRGNAPAIFGDIFQLLDRDNNGVSEYGISNEAIAAYAYGDKTKKVKIPANLFILATMNTSDQNVFTLDTAFKRRWTMKHIDNDIDACKFADHTICGNDITWGAFAKTINNLIIETNTENLSNEDNRLGAYFVKEHELDDPSCFGEKVLMYLWNDAFKYDHEKVFRSDYRTLDELIVGFKDEGMNIFVDEVDFSVATPSGTMIFEASGRDMPIDNYLAGKKNHLVAYYNELRDLVKEQIPDIRETSTASLQYAAWRADNISKASFADFQIQSERIVIFTEVPTSATELAVGEEIPKDGHHNHYYKIIYNENEVNEIVGIIVESYEQLKKE